MESFAWIKTQRCMLRSNGLQPKRRPCAPVFIWLPSQSCMQNLPVWLKLSILSSSPALDSVFPGQVSAPQDLVSSFQRCLLSPKTSTVGQSTPLVLCLCLSPKSATGNALEILTFKSLSRVFILANWALWLRWYFIYIFFYERTWLDCEASR